MPAINSITISITLSAALACCSSVCRGADVISDPVAPPGYVQPVPGKMVFVPGGVYPLGDSKGVGDSEREGAGNTAFIHSFSIDEQLTTNAEYNAYAKEHSLSPAYFVSLQKAVLSRPLQPVVGVSLSQAASYCASLGKRLPTEWEWEVAARSGTTSIYPWGDESPLTGPLKANLGSEFAERLDPSAYGGHDGFTFPSPVGAFPAGKTAWGLYDMAGNVWQWTTTDFNIGAYALFAKANDPPPAMPSSGYVTVRGGSWTSSSWSARSTARRLESPYANSLDVGFRCARDGGGSR